MKNSSEEKIDQIRKLIADVLNQQKKSFIPGETVIPTGCAVFGEGEILAVIESLLGGWLGLSEKGKQFETMFAEHAGCRHSLFVNSGSSANLLALAAAAEVRKPSGREIITPACAFPTTVNPIIQLGFTPAFVDIDESLNMCPEAVQAAVNENTAGIIFAHTLGNPARVEEIKQTADRYGLFLIEDCCSALDSLYSGRKCGTFGDASSFSFYASHGITTGEGGAVCTENSGIDAAARSLRDWGRLSTAGGKDGEKGDYTLDDIPYDSRYVYSRIGYNMKPIDLQAAMGIEQLKRAEEFKRIRKRNFSLLSEGLSAFEPDLTLPRIHQKSDPVFFGFPILINSGKIERKELISFLNRHRIDTRLLFAGDIRMQPGYQHAAYKEYGGFEKTDHVLKNCFWTGVHQGMTEEMIEYVLRVFRKYFESGA